MNESLKETPTAEALPIFEFPRKKFQHHYTFDEAIRRYSYARKQEISYGYLIAIQKHLKAFVKYLKDDDVKSFYTVKGKIPIQN